MKTYRRVVVLTCMLVVGIASLAFAQSADDFVNDLEFERIVRASVHPIDEGSSTHYLYVIAQLNNKNAERTLKIVSEGTSRYGFNFEIQDVDQENVLHPIGEATCIYDVPPEPYPVCHDTPKQDILLAPNSSKEVLFVVKLEKPALETVIYLLNFLGRYVDNQYFKITGRFDLGVKSQKGWTYAEALRVEWMFCPDKNKDLPISTCPMEMF